MIPPRFIPPILTPEQQELLNRPPNPRLDIIHYNGSDLHMWRDFWHNFKAGFRTRWPYMIVAMFVIAGLVLSPTHSFISALLLVGLFIFTALGLVTSLLHMYLTRHTLFGDIKGHGPTVEADLSNVFPLGRSGYRPFVKPADDAFPLQYHSPYVSTPPQGGSVIAPYTPSTMITRNDETSCIDYETPLAQYVEE